jgi:hypothetical protein
MKTPRDLKKPEDKKNFEEEVYKIQGILGQESNLYDSIKNSKQALEIIEKSKYKKFHNPKEIKKNILWNIYSMAKGNKVEITEKGEGKNLVFFLDKNHDENDSFSGLLSELGFERKDVIKRLVSYEKENLQHLLDQMNNAIVENVKQENHDLDLIFNFDLVYDQLKKVSSEFGLPSKINDSKIFLWYSKDMIEKIVKFDPRKLYSDKGINNFIRLSNILKKQKKKVNEKESINETLKKVSRVYGQNRRKFKAWAEKEQDRIYESAQNSAEKENEFIKLLELSNFLDFSSIYKKLLDETDESIQSSVGNVLYKK